VLEVDGVTKIFTSKRRGPTTAVDNATFDVKHGEVVGLVGANGAGKTTTIKCMAGLVIPTKGDVVLDGVSVTRSPRRAAKNVAVVLEGNRNLYWRMNCNENIEFFAGLQGIKRKDGERLRDELLERFGLGDKARTPARMLSRGMQQKLALACALARKTPILLLDEPTLGLDVETSHELRGFIRELARDGHTILLSSHDMDVVQAVADRVVVIVGGRVVANDTVPQLLALFRAQAYHFTVTTLTDGQRAALTERFPLVACSQGESGVVVQVEFADDRGLYDLIAILESGGSAVLSIDRQEPDLEQVFLKLVEGARA
jgi:ABC-2 type transport system ATP-binding protein